MRLPIVCSLFVLSLASALAQSNTVLTVTTIAGHAGVRGYADGTGTNAQFYGPAGLAFDSAGNLFVADTCNSTIRKITPAGVVTLFAGGQFDTDANRIGIGSADGTGTGARFYLGSGSSSDGTPYGPPVSTQIGSISMAADGSGNLYVADTLNNTVRKITPAGVVTTLAGSPGNQGSNDGTGSNARFLSPMGVAVDGSGNVFVTDSGNGTVRKITPAGVVTTFAGTPRTSGSDDGTGSSARFNNINGIVADSAGNLYVADTNNHIIRKITPAGAVTTPVGTAGTPGSSDGIGNKARFNYPSSLAIDASGNLYVADAGNRTIRKVTPAGLVTTLAGLARTSGSTDGTGNAARFGDQQDDDRQNVSIAVDASGNIYLSDSSNNTIRKGVPTASASGANLQLQSQPLRQYVKQGQSVTFSVSATGTPAPTYQWQKDGVTLSGATGPSYTIGATQYTDAGDYSVAVTSGLVTITSGAAQLKVFSPSTDLSAIIIVGQPTDQSVIAGQTAILSVDAVANPLPTYQWQKSGIAISGATSAIYTINSAQTSDAGVYTVVITNSAGTATSNPTTLTVTVPGNTAPSITSQPSSQTITVGSSATFSVTASGSPTPTYQWKKNGTVISGATSSSLTLSNAQTGDGGSYTVTVTNVAGSATSNAATLTVNPVVTTSSRITGLSIRIGAGTGDNILIAGFIVSGDGKSLLVRGVGPTLANYGVTSGFLADPQLKLFNGNTQIDGNDNWSTAANASQVASVAAQLQDFPLPSGSLDAALLTMLNGGVYTAQVSGASNTTGIALVEVYDANSTAASRLTGVSARTQVGTGDNILIAGFIISGNAPKTVLIRGVGPTLANYGVTSGFLADPQLVVKSNSTTISSNDNWSTATNATQVAAAATQLQDFPLPSGSKDAALLLTLDPGVYTAQVSGVGNTTGIALVEVYDVSN